MHVSEFLETRWNIYSNILSIIRIKTIINRLTRNLKFLGHFKGIRYKMYWGKKYKVADLLEVIIKFNKFIPKKIY